MNAIVEGLLRAGHTVKVLALNTNKYYIDLREGPLTSREPQKMEAIYVNLAIKPMDAFLNLFTSKSYHVERFITRELDQKVKEILEKEKFDIVQLETLYVAPYVDTIRKFSDAKIVLRAHNIEHLIWERIAGNCKNPIKKFYLSHLYKTLKKFELETIGKVDGIAAITGNDAIFFQKFGQGKPVIDIPFGVNPEEYKISDTEAEVPSLFHLGSMNWVPNQEGIRWFLEHVWPAVHKMFPNLKFYLAGRMMPDWLLKSDFPGLEVVGEVDSASDFIQSKMVMIVPLFSGSGIRIKIIEGMALKRAVISTPIGAEGINCLSGENILIAETADEYIQWIIQCVENEQFCYDIGNKARMLIESEHNNDRIIARLSKFYKEITLP